MRVVTDEVTENINARNKCDKSFIKNTFAFRRTDAQVHIVQLVKFLLLCNSNLGAVLLD